MDTFSRGIREGQPGVDGIPMLIIWALGLMILAHVVLTRTRFGNWIFAAGGDAQAARYVGLPVNRVKIQMFMFTAFCATVFATCQVMEFGSAGADRGLLKEFEAIIAVLIGGALLTGGYGSVVGALIFGVVQQGLFFTGVKSSLFQVFLGVILLLAVILGINLRSPEQAVGTLSGGERQTVAIARAVHFGARVLILDEPASALGGRQTANVLSTINTVRKTGIGIVFIAHNVRHAMAVGDRFTVMNRGKTLGTVQRGQITPEELQFSWQEVRKWSRSKDRWAAPSDHKGRHVTHDRPPRNKIGPGATCARAIRSCQVGP